MITGHGVEGVALTRGRARWQAACRGFVAKVTAAAHACLWKNTKLGMTCSALSWPFYRVPVWTKLVPWGVLFGRWELRSCRTTQLTSPDDNCTLFLLFRWTTWQWYHSSGRTEISSPRRCAKIRTAQVTRRINVRVIWLPEPVFPCAENHTHVRLHLSTISANSSNQHQSMHSVVSRVHSGAHRSVRRVRTGSEKQCDSVMERE